MRLQYSTYTVTYLCMQSVSIGPHSLTLNRASISWTFSCQESASLHPIHEDFLKRRRRGSKYCVCVISVLKYDSLMKIILIC